MIRYILFSSLILCLAACDQNRSKGPSDTPDSGTIRISVDESFAPVIQEMISTYTSLYPSARIEASYKSESDCLKDFFRDSATRLVLVTRGLSNKEDRFLRDSLGYAPGYQVIASDAVVVITHANSPDTMLTQEDLRAVFAGSVKNKKAVFDGKRATSALRFIRDSIMKGTPIDTSVVMAAANSREVIEYVSGNEQAIGLIGFSWIGNPEIPEQVQSLQKVRLAYIRCESCEGKPFVRPARESIGTRRYPLTRDLYYIIKEHHTGLGTGFTGFMKFEQGQLIFRRSYLRPVMDFDVRNVSINILSESGNN